MVDQHHGLVELSAEILNERSEMSKLAGVVPRPEFKEMTGLNHLCWQFVKVAHVHFFSFSLNHSFDNSKLRDQLQLYLNLSYPETIFTMDRYGTF